MMLETPKPTSRLTINESIKARHKNINSFRTIFKPRRLSNNNQSEKYLINKSPTLQGEIKENDISPISKFKIESFEIRSNELM